MRDECGMKSRPSGVWKDPGFARHRQRDDEKDAVRACGWAAGENQRQRRKNRGRCIFPWQTDAIGHWHRQCGGSVRWRAGSFPLIHSWHHCSPQVPHRPKGAHEPMIF